MLQSLVLLHGSIVVLSHSTPKLSFLIPSLKTVFTIILQQHLKRWCCTFSLYEGIKQQLMCSSWKFCVVLFTPERSATLTKTPLKLKSRQRSSQERQDCAQINTAWLIPSHKWQGLVISYTKNGLNLYDFKGKPQHRLEWWNCISDRGTRGQQSKHCSIC